jgi:hypothetical protein
MNTWPRSLWTLAPNSINLEYRSATTTSIKPSSWSALPASAHDRRNHLSESQGTTVPILNLNFAYSSGF